MKIADWIAKLAGLSVGELIGVLKFVADGTSDFAPKATEILGKLDMAASAENLAALGAAIPGELLNISKFQFRPADSPSNDA